MVNNKYGVRRGQSSHLRSARGQSFLNLLSVMEERNAIASEEVELGLQRVGTGIRNSPSSQGTGVGTQNEAISPLLIEEFGLQEAGNETGNSRGAQSSTRATNPPVSGGPDSEGAGSSRGIGTGCTRVPVIGNIDGPLLSGGRDSEAVGARTLGIIGTGDTGPLVIGDIGSEGTGGFTEPNVGVGGITPLIIAVPAGEDLAGKILQLFKQGPCSMFVMTANGFVTDPRLSREPFHDEEIKYEGEYCILKLSAKFHRKGADDIENRSLTVSLAGGTKGNVIGGIVLRSLIAASPIRVVIGILSSLA